jgi:hypothetical protein
MNNIYDKINDMDFATDEIDLSDLEKARLMKVAKAYSKKSYKKKIIAIACALILVAGFGISPARAELVKVATDVKVSMMEAFGASPDSYKYVTSLNQPISLGDDDFVIGNLAFDNKFLFINTLRKADEQDTKLNSTIYKLVVNGKTYKLRGSSGSEVLLEDGKTTSENLMLNFDKDFLSLENADVDLYYMNGNATKVVSLKADVNTVNDENKILAENMPLANSQAKISLMKINPISLTCLIENLDDGYSYDLEGVDKDGRKVSLDERLMEDGKASFVYNKDFSDLSLDEIRDGREIKFSLKASKRNKESGKETDGNYQTISEFTCSLK